METRIDQLAGPSAERAMKMLYRTCLALAVVALASTSAFSDPVMLGGTVTLDGFEALANTTLTSSDFSFTGGIDATFISGAGPFVGPTLAINTFLSPGLVNSGSGTVLGVSYPQLFIGGSLALAGSVALPATTPPGESVTLSTPFIGSGVLDFGATPASIVNGNGFFSDQVVGFGTATINLQASPAFPAGEPPRFTFQNISFAFEPRSSSPTPEPASMLLLGTGLLGVVVRRFRAAA